MFGYVLTDTMFCTLTDISGADPCLGDSGGPLIQTNEQNESIQVGIISWGLGCGKPGSYGVYTDAGSVLEWIESYVVEEEPHAQTVMRKLGQFTPLAWSENWLVQQLLH